MTDMQPAEGRKLRLMDLNRALYFLWRAYVQRFKAGGVWALLIGFLLIVSILCLLAWLRHGDVGSVVSYSGSYQGIKSDQRKWGRRRTAQSIELKQDDGRARYFSTRGLPDNRIRRTDSC